ncbi:MAG: DUF2147 domain-containing protein [Flavobacteriales bacterium]|jgi:uncharacterized protein (DUF2147 family)
MMKRMILFFAMALMMPVFASAQDANADKLVGVWEPSHGKARVKVEKIGTKFYGKIVWLKEPNDPETGKPKVDKNNPEEALRNTPLKGYRLLKDFIYKGNKEWSEGTIYDPENGSTYKCVIRMKDDNTLEIRGYIGVEALGRTDVWKRLEIKK